MRRIQSSITLEVGGVYQVRDADICKQHNKPSVRTIEKELPKNYMYDFEDDQGETYLQNGRFLVKHPCRHDLVKRIK